MSQAVFEQGEAQIAKSRKYNRTSQPDLEAVKEETIDLHLESKEKIVDKRQDGSRGNPI